MSFYSFLRPEWTSWIHRLSSSKARSRLVALITIALICILYVSWSRPWSQNAQPLLGLSHDLINDGKEPHLPEDYASSSPNSAATGMCAERFGTEYIRKFSESPTSYCDSNTSTAGLTCFTHKADDSRTDTFCVGGPATLHPARRKFDLNCTLDSGGTASPRFSSYWYNTGPRVVFDNYIDLSSPEDLEPVEIASKRTLFLIKREDTVINMWHTLMQVMSLALSLDVLRMTRDPSTGMAFFTDNDIKDSQVVILDDYKDGYFFDLWSMFASIPPVRFSEIRDAASYDKIVIPLPGGSNPMWQGDWVDTPCNESALLETFARRILNFYHIDTSPREHSSLTLTLVDRTNKRHLVDQDAYFSALQAKYPDVKMQVVDFAQLAFSEQLEIVRSTDILVGVHGAGLTHGMFLSPGSTMAEILPPTLNYKGFQNMAKMLKHRYFNRHAIPYEYPGKTGDWHDDDIFIEEDRFMELMSEAIESAGR